MEEHQLKQALLQKYLDGTYSKDELQKLYELLLKDEDNEQYSPVTNDVWERLVAESYLPQERADAVFNRALATVAERAASGRTFVWHKMAAVFVGLLFFCGIILLVLPGRDSRVIITHNGEQRRFILPDRSIVTLAAGSSLSFSKNWEESKSREVILEGEAFFEVVKNKNKPFLVKTKEIQIKVLGTSFNIKAYKEDETVEATLVTGAINLTTNTSNDKERASLVMKPNERAVYHKQKQALALAPARAEEYTGWKESKLIFKDVAFAQVIKDLERWYGVDIHMKNQDTRCPFTAKFEKETLSEVLRLIAKTSSIKYKIEGKEVFIEGSFCK